MSLNSSAPTTIYRVSLSPVGGGALLCGLTYHRDPLGVVLVATSELPKYQMYFVKRTNVTVT